MEYDLGIVLAHEIDENGKLSRESRVRVDAGIRLAGKGIVGELVMSGGHIQGYDFSVASRMRDYAETKGTSAIVSTEEISLDTLGQLVFLKECVIDPRRIKSFILITHYWHSAKTEFMAYSLFDETYNIGFKSLEPNRYEEKRRWDFTKLPMFIKSFPLEAWGGDSLINFMIKNHPWYHGDYPPKRFGAEYFLNQSEELKRQNTK